MLLRCFIRRVTGHDAIHQGRAESVLLFQPGLERLAQVPLVGGLEAALLQVAAVIVNQLARQQNEAGTLRSAEGGKALIKQAGQLAWEGRLGLAVKAVFAGIHDAGLRRIGDDHAHVLVVRQRKVALKILIRRESALHALNDAGILHRLAIHLTAQNLGVQAVLFIQHADHAALDGLHDHNAGVHTGGFIGLINHPVTESAEEAALAKLNHTLGLRRYAARSGDRRKRRSVKLNHGKNLPVNVFKT